MRAHPLHRPHCAVSASSVRTIFVAQLRHELDFNLATVQVPQKSKQVHFQQRLIGDRGRVPRLATPGSAVLPTRARHGKSRRRRRRRSSGRLAVGNPRSRSQPLPGITPPAHRPRPTEPAPRHAQSPHASAARTPLLLMRSRPASPGPARHVEPHMCPDAARTPRSLAIASERKVVTTTTSLGRSSRARSCAKASPGRLTQSPAEAQQPQ